MDFGWRWGRVGYVYFCYARKRAVCGAFNRFSNNHYPNKDVFSSGYNSTPSQAAAAAAATKTTHDAFFTLLSKHFNFY